MTLFRDLLIEKKRRRYYCEVEYLASNGNQYIDTGVVFSASSHTYKWDIGAQAVNTGSSDYNWFCGFYEGGANSVGTYSDTTTNYKFYVVGTYYQNGQVITSPLTNGDKYGIIRNILTLTNFAGTLSVILFGRNQSNGVKCEATKKIFYYKIYDNDTLVRDFIPVLDWNMTPCMYDKVSGKLFYNQGTGSFTYGREIHYVDYLESTGTQYIDTDYKPTVANYGYDVKFIITENTGSTQSPFTTYYTWAGSYPLYIYGVTTYTMGRILPDLRAGQSSTSGIDVGWTYGTEINMSLHGDTLKYNGTSYTATRYTNFTEKQSAVNLYLFAFHRGADGIIGEFSKAKLYYIKLYEGDTLIRDYIPAIDENGVGFMLDKVSHTCFLNQGTGAFKYPAREVEYLENTQTWADRNWINTGVITNTQTKWEVRVAYNDTATGKLMGSGTSGNVRFNIGIESNRFRFGFGINWFDANSEILTPDTNPHTWVLDCINKTGTIDGYSASTTNEFGENNSIPICLFGRSNTWSGDTETGNVALCKIYYSKIWQDGTLVRDLVPCLKDGAGCMVDKLTETVYLNQGAGTFTFGKIVEPEYE